MQNKTHLVPVFLGHDLVDGDGLVVFHASVGVDAKGKVGPELGSQVQGIGRGASVVHGGSFRGKILWCNNGRIRCFCFGRFVTDWLENITG